MAKFNPEDIVLGEDGSLGGGIDSLHEESMKAFQIPMTKGSELKDACLVPSGPFIVDYALMGGLPDHVPSMVHGVAKSGKSTITLHHIKELQIKYPDKKILYGALEVGCFQPSWAKSIGVDLSRLISPPIQYAEEFVAIVESAIKKNQLSHIVVDSLSELTSELDVEKSAFDADKIGDNTHMCKKLFKKYNSSNTWLSKAKSHFHEKGKVLNIHKPSMMLINQRRELMGSRYPTANLPGGNVSKHFPLVIMELKGSEESDDNSDKEIVKSIHTFNLGGRNQKNKATSNLVSTGVFEISKSNLHPRVPKGHIDDFATVIKYAKRYGLTGGGAAKQTLLTCPDRNFKTMTEMANFLCSDESCYWLTRACIIALARSRNDDELDMMPPDDYLQRCNGDQIMEVLDRLKE